MSTELMTLDGTRQHLSDETHDWVTDIPDEITTRVLCWTMPDAPILPPEVHGREVMILAAVHAGDPADGEKLCAPLAEMGEPLAELSQAMPYRVAQSEFDPFSRDLDGITPDIDDDELSIHSTWVDGQPVHHRSDRARG